MSNTSVCFEMPSELYEQLVAYVEEHPDIDWNVLGAAALASYLEGTLEGQEDAA